MPSTRTPTPPDQRADAGLEPRAVQEAGFDVGRLIRRIAVFIIVGFVGLVAVATLPGVGEVRERLAAAEPHWIAVMALCSLASMVGFAAALYGAFERIVPFRNSVELGFAEQGANVLLPAGGAGGPALGALMMRRAGVPTDLAAERHVALFLVTSLVSFVALVVAGLVVGIKWLPGGEAGPVGSFVPAGVGLAVLATALLFARTDVPAEPVGAGRVRMGIWRARGFLHGGVRTSLTLIRSGQRWFILGALAYYAFDVAALAASFQAFGGGAPPVGVFILAYTIGHAGALIPSPGGVGGTEGGLIGMFVVYDTPLALATTAVFGYRVFQLGMPVLLGGLSMLVIQKRLGDDARRRAVTARFADLGYE